MNNKKSKISINIKYKELIVVIILLIWIFYSTNGTIPYIKKSISEFERNFNFHKGNIGFATESNLLMKYRNNHNEILILKDGTRQQDIDISIKKEEAKYYSKEELLNRLLKQIKDDKIMTEYYKSNNPFKDCIISKKYGPQIENDSIIDRIDLDVFAHEFKYKYYRDLSDNWGKIKVKIDDIIEMNNDYYKVNTNVYIYKTHESKKIEFIIRKHSVENENVRGNVKRNIVSILNGGLLDPNTFFDFKYY